jgi:hypothetical protein
VAFALIEGHPEKLPGIRVVLFGSFCATVQFNEPPATVEYFKEVIEMSTAWPSLLAKATRNSSRALSSALRHLRCGAINAPPGRLSQER